MEKSKPSILLIEMSFSCNVGLADCAHDCSAYKNRMHTQFCTGWLPQMRSQMDVSQYM
jgi:hypothetical protein